ncbi:der [Symbiodinium necroappetens]|uniref:Der protein n=1 Tax=Symbiodinium necroappetens TaxID=1628268 RepID=A0A813A9Z5_9DINO|nr:der [Symbiodinium necroappetens]
MTTDGTEDSVERQPEEDGGIAAQSAVYSFEEVQKILAPPLSDQANWPGGLELCSLRRVLWLPPGWGQAWKKDSNGFRRKVFVAPKNLGSKIVHHKSHVQAAYDHELVPVDQKGRHLPRKFPDHWPSWLPKSWQMTFDGLASDPSFRSPSEELFNSEEAVKRHLVEIGALEKPKAAPKTKAKAQGKARQKKTKIGALPEPAKKLRRLRKLAPEECQVPEDFEVPPPPPKPLPSHLRRLRRVGDRKKTEAAKKEEEEPTPPTVNLENLTAEERDYLENHPLYIKIHQRGYPIPIGDLDILALRPFIPMEFGGSGKQLQPNVAQQQAVSDEIRAECSLRKQVPSELQLTAEQISWIWQRNLFHTRQKVDEVAKAHEVSAGTPKTRHRQSASRTRRGTVQLFQGNTSSGESPAINKWDLIHENDQPKYREEILKRIAECFSSIKGVPVVFLSAKYNLNLPMLMTRSLALYKRWCARLPTSRLNSWLQAWMLRWPPPWRNGQKCSIKYMTQTRARPPTFVLWTNSAYGEFPKNYIRQMQNAMRDEFRISGVPLSFNIRSTLMPKPRKKLSKMLGQQSLPERWPRYADWCSASRCIIGACSRAL